jgi:peroxiredoxin
MLKVGEIAPEIDAMASDGTRFVLSVAAQGSLCTIVYFFPKAFTPGCTAEAGTFRDNRNELLLAGAHVVGISTDDESTQCKFAESVRANFPLIGDADKSISKAYGVLWPLLGVTRRVTFVVDPQRRVEAIFRHEIQIARHRDDVLSYVHEKLTKGRSERPVKA